MKWLNAGVRQIQLDMAIRSELYCDMLEELIRTL